MRASTAPSRSRSGARRWSNATRSGTSFKKSQHALGLEGARPRHGPADRLGVRRSRRSHVAAAARTAWSGGGRLICTDDWAPCAAALPVGRHYVGKDLTQRIESNNVRQRHWFARLRRRTCVVSKSVATVEATMALFAFYHCNGGKLAPALVG